MFNEIWKLCLELIWELMWIYFVFIEWIKYNLFLWNKVDIQIWFWGLQKECESACLISWMCLHVGCKGLRNHYCSKKKGKNPRWYPIRFKEWGIMKVCSQLSHFEVLHNVVMSHKEMLQCMFIVCLCVLVVLQMLLILLESC